MKDPDDYIGWGLFALIAVGVMLVLPLAVYVWMKLLGGMP